MAKLVLKGIGVSAGKATGKVRLVVSAQGLADFRQGEVLVARITDPFMTIAMGRAAAIVCEIGGMTSHPAIVSREMGIPCVVAVKGATKKLRNGFEVAVDGSKGTVSLK